MRTELLGQLDRYLIGAASLQALEAWLLANLQAILDTQDENVIAMANDVDASLMALSEGLIDEEELRQRVAAQAERAHTIWVPAVAVAARSTIAASSSETVHRMVQIPGAVVSLHLSHQFA